MFRQLLPVIKGGNRAEIVNSCFKASMLWSLFERLSLTKNVRLINAPSAALAKKHDSWLCLVGDGVAQSSDLVDLSFQNVVLIRASRRHSYMKDALYWVFSNFLAVSFRAFLFKANESLVPDLIV